MFGAGTWCRPNEYPDRLDRAMEWLLMALLAFMPFAFGAVEAWSEEVVLLLTAALSVCFCVRLLMGRDRPVLWTWAYVPVLAFLAVAVLQLVPLPFGLLRLISPNTALQKAELLADLHGGDAVRPALEISFYRCATRHDLRLVLAAGAVFVVVLNVWRRPGQILRLLQAVVVIGAGVALLALAQNVAGNDKLYWFVTSPHGTARSGPFVNHSHYAQFMNLSLGAALALALVRVHQVFAGRRVTPAAAAEYLGSPEARFLWGLGAMMVVGMATIFASLSRGGVVSLMMAAAFTALVISSRRSLRGSGWAMALLALGAFICVLYIGFDAVYDRLSTLRELHQAQGGRWQIVKDVAVAWTKFPVVGTGLGTHEVVYPMFDRSTIATLASHAENEYAQAAEETGLAGLAALVALGVLVWRSYARTVRAGRAPIHSAAYGLGFGLIAILVHSLSDFGQHVPANAFLSVIFCALLLRLPHIGAAGIDRPTRADVPARWPWVAALLVSSMVWGWALWDADRARAGAAHWRQALAGERGLAERQWQGSDEEYQYLLRHSQKAAACQPGNILYRHWLDVYRWRAISRTVDPNTGEIVLPGESWEFAARIADDLSQARMLCPTFGVTWCVLGQLERHVLGQAEQGARHIRRGVQLAPCDPTAQLVAGMLEAEEGRTEAALAHLVRAVRLDSGFFREVAGQLIGSFGRPDLALQTAGQDMRCLSVLAEVLETSDARTDATDDVRRQVTARLEQKCREPGAPAWAFAWLAGACQREGRLPEAVAYYREALASDYGKFDWHFELAKLLADAGVTQEAMQEAKVCLRLRPEHAGSRRLVEKLSADLCSDGPGR
jgi:tetratricopeptide (TPR) repeat protein